jgi:hypothetical protein
MSFKDMVASDLRNIFLNTEEFANVRTIIYDGMMYGDIPIVLTSMKEQDRKQTVNDHAEGLYIVTEILHCARADLDGVLPEQGMTIQISDADGYFDKFTVAQAGDEDGMLRIELEAFDE